jgi:hypothetical protein
MKFDLLKSRIIAWLLGVVAVLVLAANAYNSWKTTGLFDVAQIMQSSFTSLTTLAGAVGMVAAHNRDHDGNLLASVKEADKES